LGPIFVMLSIRSVISAMTLKNSRQC
jgi:hypothetical protein